MFTPNGQLFVDNTSGILKFKIDKMQFTGNTLREALNHYRNYKHLPELTGRPSGIAYLQTLAGLPQQPLTPEQPLITPHPPLRPRTQLVFAPSRQPGNKTVRRPLGRRRVRDAARWTRGRTIPPPPPRTAVSGTVPAAPPRRATAAALSRRATAAAAAAARPPPPPPTITLNTIAPASPPPAAASTIAPASPPPAAASTPAPAPAAAPAPAPAAASTIASPPPAAVSTTARTQPSSRQELFSISPANPAPASTLPAAASLQPLANAILKGVDQEMPSSLPGQKGSTMPGYARNTASSRAKSAATMAQTQRLGRGRRP